MLQINIYVKFALIAACFIGGGILWAAYGFWYSSIFLLAGIILLVSYLLLGTVQSAAELMQKMDFDGAEQRLELTYFPGLLYVSNKAFYYIIKGTAKLNKEETSAAEELFNKALSLKLPTETEKAMVLMQLANINARKNKWNAAKNYFKEAQKLKVTQPELKQQMEEFDKAIKNRGQMKAAQSMGRRGHQMMRPSGKRRRPKGR